MLKKGGGRGSEFWDRGLMDVTRRYNQIMRSIYFVLIFCLFLLSACGGVAVDILPETAVVETLSVDVSEPAQPAATLPAVQAAPSATLVAPSPVPPTITPIPGVFAIVDGDTGFLIGGSQDTAWLNADMTAPYLIGGEEYRLFNSTEYLGNGLGTKAGTIEAGPCTRNYTVALDPEPEFMPALLVGGTWDVLPRTTMRLAPAQVYKDEIETLLIDQGIADPVVAIISILRVDLEGDGVDEVLITAIQMASGGVLPPVTAGDYSLIVLRKLVDGEVVTMPLVMDIYLESEDLAYPTVYIIGGVYDLNGDGRLEVVLEGKRWEGQSVSVFDIEGAHASLVLGVSCGE